MELAVVHAFDHRRVIALRHERARCEDHAAVQVLDAEFGMQAVVDAGREFVDALLVDMVHPEQRQIIVLVLQGGSVVHLLGSLEHANVVAVVEHAHDLPVLLRRDAYVLHQLGDLPVAQGDSRRLGLQYQCRLHVVAGKIPPVRLVLHPGESKLVERRDLADVADTVPSSARPRILPACSRTSFSVTYFIAGPFPCKGTRRNQLPIGGDVFHRVMLLSDSHTRVALPATVTVHTSFHGSKPTPFRTPVNGTWTRTSDR